MGKGDVSCYEVLGMSTVAGIPSVPDTPVVASVPVAVDTMLIHRNNRKRRFWSPATIVYGPCTVLLAPAEALWRLADKSNVLALASSAFDVLLPFCLLLLQVRCCDCRCYHCQICQFYSCKTLGHPSHLSGFYTQMLKVRRWPYLASCPDVRDKVAMIWTVMAAWNERGLLWLY